MVESIVCSEAGFDSVLRNSLCYEIWSCQCNQIFDFVYFLGICIVDKISSPVVVLEEVGSIF